MQPEPSNASKNTSTQQPTPETPEAAHQHGIRHPEPSALLLSSSGDNAGPKEPDGSEYTDQDVDGPSRVANPETQEATRLNRTPSPPRNRIDEYENFLTPPQRNWSEGPSFEVIKKAFDKTDSSCYIDKLPNEVLTHALSHLSPTDLSAVSVVSRRFHSLVTTPHAWRAAFGRYFPGSESILQSKAHAEEQADILPSGKRVFTRLTALASWRSEYILRTRLLRSLGRGKPVMAAPTPATVRAGQTQTAPAMVNYNSQLFTTVNCMHATFGTGLNKRMPRFIHGADEIGIASSSDPSTTKVDAWGLTDPQPFFQFSDAYPGDAQWGLGSGEFIGCPNVMDVSQPYGMVYGDGHPGAGIYYRGTDELRGRDLAQPADETNPDIGLPQISPTRDCVTSVWIAKSSAIPSLSQGLIGILCGLSDGIISSYSLGTDGLRGKRLQRGEVTARWVLSPGVPIISIAVDNEYSLKRQAQNRIWAVALNALGELFYLTKFPTQPNERVATSALEECAWLRGRTTFWTLVEPSRRVARINPYGDSDVNGSYSPRSSWDGNCLSNAQIRAETREMDEFMRKKPKDFRKMCTSWDMRRKIEVDFAGDDGSYAGESIAVFECGLDEDTVSRIQRFTRCKFEDGPGQKDPATIPTDKSLPASSLFGGPTASIDRSATPPRTRRASTFSSSSSPERGQLVEEWRISNFSFGDLKSIQVTATAIDSSTFATLTASEDPTLGFSTMSNASSPFGSPRSMGSQPTDPADIPGQRARFIAAGTSTGVVLLWDIRAPVAKNAEFPNTVEPVRIIFTDSPEISCLALTALYLVHGGNDGLVQAWDTLASSAQPIRTLHSRFSSRARRRLAQAQASVQGVGINMFAAGAICLDPDATVLRGMVSLGNLLRYWSYSSSAADQFKSSKRRLRRGERGSNNGGERFAAGRSSNLKDYIANEKLELEREQRTKRREANRLAGRFGVDLLDNEDEALAYAALLSQESLANEEKRRQSESNSSTHSDDTVIVPGYSPSVPSVQMDDELDPDIAEAIRLSLGESPAMSPPSADSGFEGFDIPIKYAKSRRSPPSRAKKGTSPKGGSPSGVAEGSNKIELDDLEFAMQLSLAEEQSRVEAMEDYPSLSPRRANSDNGGKGKGKGKERA